MFEKCNPSHPDKIADRIAGAIVDLAYFKVNGDHSYKKNPKVAVEVLIGHGKCYVINETDTHLENKEVSDIVERVANNSFISTFYHELPQDKHLAKNQETLHCGDNGIFKGVKTSFEEKELVRIVECIYHKYPYDGKYIITNDDIIACQSNCKALPIKTKSFNPLGYWTGGIDVDSGATNRKLGSDMGQAATGGGLHGKDLTKADVSVNIYLHQLANQYATLSNCAEEMTAVCAIGDKKVKIKGTNTLEIDFNSIVASAREYIIEIGGFEKLAEWGLIR